MEKKALSKPFFTHTNGYLSSVSPHDRHAAEAEELMQEAFLQLFAKSKPFVAKPLFHMAAPRSHEHLAHAPRKRKLKNFPWKMAMSTIRKTSERQYGSADLSSRAWSTGFSGSSNRKAPAGLQACV